MAQVWANRFYHSKQWRDTRRVYIDKVNGLCERCLSRGKIKLGYILHHKEKLTEENINNINISLNQNNLEFVCLICHNKDEYDEHGTRKRRYIFDEDGEIVEKKTRGVRDREK